MKSLRLVDGNRVCIVGGGPAGSFSAIHLLRLCRSHNIELEVLIFESRDFNKPGPAGCNRCAGILSSRLVRELDNVGISMPDEIIQSELSAYALHLGNKTVCIEQPDPTRKILSVYRGGGPRLITGESVSSFDEFLLEQALALGAQHIAHRVRNVTRDGRPVLHTVRGKYEADLLVLASGVNSRSPLSSHYDYKPPHTEVMAQDEIVRPESWSSEKVDAYFRSPPGLIFGAITPKRGYLNISLLGKGMKADAVDDFITTQGLRKDLKFNGSSSLCGCNPRIATGPAKNYFGDRWVTVGDAAATRLYKDGIGSAFHTARMAAHTAVNRGISKHQFRKYYAPTCRRITSDNVYGKMLFNFWNFTLRNAWLMKAWERAVTNEMNEPVSKQMHIRILWGMFTGDENYRNLFKLIISPAALVALFFNKE